MLLRTSVFIQPSSHGNIINGEWISIKSYHFRFEGCPKCGKEKRSLECVIIAFSKDKLIRGIFTLIFFQGYYPHATIKKEDLRNK
jgi:hypothetical protein